MMYRICNSGLAFVRKWPHAVHSGSNRQSNEGAERKTQTSVPRLRSGAAAINAKHGAISCSSDAFADTDECIRGVSSRTLRTLPAAISYRRSRGVGADRVNRANRTISAISAVRIAMRGRHLLELWLYGVLQHTCSWCCRDIEHARAGGANWRITLPINLSVLLRWVPQ